MRSSPSPFRNEIARKERGVANDEKQDPVVHVLENRKGEAVHQLEQLAFEARHNKDLEYMKRAKALLKPRWSSTGSESGPFIGFQLDTFR
jgi:hypothetical protein